MPRAKKPPAKKFTAHQITLDPESRRYLQRLAATVPGVDSLSAAIRYVTRCHQAVANSDRQARQEKLS